MNQLWPYDLLIQLPELAVVAAFVDGQELPKVYIDDNAMRIDIAATKGEKWTDAVVEVAMTLPWAEILDRRDLVGDICVLLRCQCDATNVRQSVLVPARRGEEVSGKLVLPSREYSRRAVIDAFVVGTVRLNDEPSQNRVLAAAPNWEVRFDEPPPRNVGPRPPGKKTGKRRLAEPEWANFSDPPQNLAFLTDFKDEPYFLRLSDDPPVLYMNEGIPGYRLLMDDEVERKRQPMEVALREREMLGIAANCWTSMFASACAAVDPGEGEQEPSLPDGWRGDAIGALAPHVFPDHSVLEALKMISAAREDHSGKEMTTVLELAQAAAARYVGSGRKLRRTLQRSLN